ncbi:MAG: glutaredoxin family protein [Cyanobacteria bacterium J06634_6]
MKQLILYSKPGCHLCEGLQEKLETLPIELEIRDITQKEAWLQKYQYEVPVLCQTVAAEGVAPSQLIEQPLPRMSPRASAAQVAQIIQTHVGPFEA